MKRLPFPILAFLMIFIPVFGIAQSFPRPVAVMPFTGEEDEVNDQFRSSVTVEIQNLDGNFSPSPAYLPDGMTAEELPPDEPPPGYMVEGTQYVVTGASFPDSGEHHLQVWLWDVLEPTLIYTDELVCEEIEDAAEFMPLLIEWIFSHVPPEEEYEEEEEEEYVPVVTVLPPLEPEVEAEPPRGQRAQSPTFEDEDKWFFLGFRLGASARSYTAVSTGFLNDPANVNDKIFLDEKSRLSPTFEGAFQATVQLLPFLALQGEVLFTMDFTSFQVYEANQSEVIPYNVNYTSMNLMLPVVAKITLMPIPFVIAPFGGAYYILPLGQMTMVNTLTDKRETLSYTYEMPAIGWIAGLNVGMKLSHIRKGLEGRLFLDLRYAQDISIISMEANTSIEQLPFNRRMLSLSFGYEIGLVNRDIKSVTTTTRR